MAKKQADRNKKPPHRKWTVMVYMAGDNDLTEEMLWALKEMKRTGVGPKEEVTVVALFDPGFDVPAQRYVINKKNGPADEEGLLWEEMEPFMIAGTYTPEPNMGNLETLAEFILQGVSQYPAQHYMVVLSGHSGGPAGSDLFLRYANKNGYGKRMRKLQSVLSQSKIAVFGLDSCLMNSAEVLHHASEHCDYLVGAQGLELSAGWPYQRILSRLVQDPGQSPRAFAKAISDVYITYYRDYALAGHSVDFAACDASMAAKLTEGISRLARRLIYSLGRLPDVPSAGMGLDEALVLAHWKAQSYNSDQDVDLFDFCEILKEQCLRQGGQGKWGKILAACQDLLDIESDVVISSCRTGSVLQHSRGLSIYFPWNWVANAYGKLSFAKASKWKAFLRAYIRKTRRQPRHAVPRYKNRVLHDVHNFNAKQAAYREWRRRFAAGGISPPPGKAGYRYTPPQSKGVATGTCSMRNPPVDWASIGCASPRASAGESNCDAIE